MIFCQEQNHSFLSEKLIPRFLQKTLKDNTTLFWQLWTRVYLSILVEDLDFFHAFSDLMKIPIVENGIVPAS